MTMKTTYTVIVQGTVGLDQSDKTGKTHAFFRKSQKRESKRTKQEF